MEHLLNAEETADAMSTIAMRSRLRDRIASLDEELKKATEAAEAAAAEAAPSAAVSDEAIELEEAAPPSVEVVEEAAPLSAEVVVTIGTSKMAQDDSDLPEKISAMVNRAYFEANKELLPPGTTTYNRLDAEEAMSRLEMGDSGPAANRVLHLAHRDGQLVGCCSSTFQPPWTPEGCGHWGLLVVDVDSQGSGVASALVAAAEGRLASLPCEVIQIEYEYTEGHAASEKLFALYETKLGFMCDEPIRRRRRHAEPGQAENQFRRCRKPVPPEMVVAHRPKRLQEVKGYMMKQMASLTGAQPGEIDRIGGSYKLQGLSQLTEYNERRCEVILYESPEADEEDEGEPGHGAYVVKLLPPDEVQKESNTDTVMLRVDAKFLVPESDQ